MKGNAKRVRLRKSKNVSTVAPTESAAVSINTGDPVVVFGTPYGKMIEVMKQLAMRDSMHEAAVMRIAKAGGITPVIDYVMMMRTYQKKHRK